MRPKTPGSGRKPGSLNKATAEVREVARVYTVEAIHELARIMRRGKNEQARIAAANALLDRAHGKPPQAITGDGGIGPVMVQIVHEHLPAD